MTDYDEEMFLTPREVEQVDAALAEEPTAIPELIQDMGNITFGLVDKDGEPLEVVLREEDMEQYWAEFPEPSSALDGLPIVVLSTVDELYELLPESVVLTAAGAAAQKSSRGDWDVAADSGWFTGEELLEHFGGPVRLLYVPEV